MHDVYTPDTLPYAICLYSKAVNLTYYMGSENSPLISMQIKSTHYEGCSLVEKCTFAVSMRQMGLTLVSKGNHSFFP